MMTLKLKSLVIVAAVSTTAAFGTHASPASAASLTWNLNAQFAGGGTATGSFDYDATSGVLSQFNIKTLPGTSAPSNFLFPGAAYTSASSTGSLQDSIRLELIGSEFSFQTLFSAPLTEVGGTISLVPSFSFEKRTFPGGVGLIRDLASGTVTASAAAVPTPALLPGLIGLGLSALRQKRKAAQAKPLS